MKARIAVAALFASTCFTASFAAHAAPDVPPGESAVAEAGQHFTKGVQLFKEWSFDAALAEFRKAYQLAPSYRVLYNIAQVNYELHNYVEALKGFRQYLTEGGSEVSIERRTQVEAEIRKLEGRVGYIEVTANVEGAQLSVDEVPVGSIPLRAPLMVNPGLRRVSGTKDGYGMTARNVTIAGGDHAQIQIEMTEIPKTRIIREAARPERSRTPMWIGLAATGALGATSGVFAILAHGAKKDFESQLETYPTTPEQIDDARSKASLYSGLADGFAVGAIVAGGATLFLALTRGSSSSPSTTAASAPPPKRIAFAPTLGGVVAVGEF
jgi:hypothetical protein